MSDAADSDIASQLGKLAVSTGANSWLGYETALRVSVLAAMSFWRSANKARDAASSNHAHAASRLPVSRSASRI